VENNSFTVCGIDHIGIVSKEDSGLSFLLENLLGFRTSEKEDVSSQKTRVQKFSLKEDSHENFSPALETLEPLNNEGSIQKYREKHKSGIHHIAIKVTHLENLIKFLLKNKIKVINETPLSGADSCKISFIHPASTSGILIELIEK